MPRNRPCLVIVDARTFVTVAKPDITTGLPQRKTVSLVIHSADVIRGGPLS
jgi:hypothetical protein